jgi:hypothetical protein
MPERWLYVGGFVHAVPQISGGMMFYLGPVMFCLEQCCSGEERK